MQYTLDYMCEREKEKKGILELQVGFRTNEIWLQVLSEACQGQALAINSKTGQIKLPLTAWCTTQM